MSEASRWADRRLDLDAIQARAEAGVRPTWTEVAKLVETAREVDALRASLAEMEARALAAERSVDDAARAAMGWMEISRFQNETIARLTVMSAPPA